MGLACQVDDRYTRIDNSATCYGWFRIMDISHGQNSTVECASGLVVYEKVGRLGVCVVLLGSTRKISFSHLWSAVLKATRTPREMLEKNMVALEEWQKMPPYVFMISRNYSLRAMAGLHIDGLRCH